MDYDPSHSAPSHPAVGMILAAVGFGGYISTTAVRWFLGAAAFAQAAADSPAAQAMKAAVPSGSWTIDNVTQVVMGVLATTGGVIAWVSSQRQKAHDAELARKKADADAEREKRREDANADLEMWVKEAMAKFQVDQVKQHAATRDHLFRQDEAIAAVKQAVASPPAAAQPPVVVIAQPTATPAVVATSPADGQDPCQKN